MTKYLEKLSEKVNNAGHFGANAKELEKVMSDREIMNAKGGLKHQNPQHIKKTTPNQIQLIEIFEQEYPELSNEFIKLYKMKCMKCLLVNIWIMV